MKIDLDKINSTGIAEIHFIKNITDLSKIKSMFNILFSKNGIYFAQSNNWGQTLSKIETLNYSNIGLFEISGDLSVSCNVPRPNISILETILETFKYVQDKTKAEFMIVLYWDIKNEKYIVDYIDQEITAGSVKYNYTTKFEMSSDYIKYLEVHSHHSMGAGFSSIDDRDEKHKGLCYYGVIGNLNKNSNIYTMGSKFRIWTGIEFYMIDIHEVFEFPQIVHNANINFAEVDNVINKFKKTQELNSVQKYSGNSDIFNFLTGELSIPTTDPFSDSGLKEHVLILKDFVKKTDIKVSEEISINKESFILSCFTEGDKIICGVEQNGAFINLSDDNSRLIFEKWLLNNEIHDEFIYEFEMVTTWIKNE